jgi:anti-sigma regulatory factor (Ser/Thr protein kinase)
MARAGMDSRTVHEAEISHAGERFVRPQLLTMSMSPHEEGPSLARRFVAHALTLVGLEEDESDAALVVSELVGNACRYAREQVTVRVELEPEDGLRIEIEDDGPGMPLLRRAEPVDTAGRGLQIVSAIADRWGAEPTADGKVVWVELMRHGIAQVSA